MRIVRRGALVLSLIVIVAVAVAFGVRRAELAGERDLRLTTSAEIAAARLDATLAAIESVAAAATDPARATRAVADIDDRISVCAVTDARRVCSGNDSAVPPVSDALGAWAKVHVYESVAAIDVAGPDLVVHVRTPIDAFAWDGADAWMVTDLPDGATVGGFAVDGDVRQTVAAVADRPGVYVAAAGVEATSLPLDEQRLYLVLLALGVVLLALSSGLTLGEQRHLLERARYDTLTKLPNRAEFEQRAVDSLAEAGRQDRGACLLLFDLNGFKQVNDTYGHQLGDELLKVVAGRLRTAVRDGDTVARWGGDEFVVLMPGIGDDEMGVRRAHDLAEAIGGRTRLDGLDDRLRIRTSVGVALWPRHGDDLHALVAAADRAMYQAKRSGSTVWIADERRRPATSAEPAQVA